MIITNLNNIAMNRNDLMPVFLVLVLLCASCGTLISYPVSTPPKIKTDAQHINRIAFVNRYDYAKLNLVNDKEKEVYISGARNVINGLENAFQSDKHFNFILIDTLITGAAPESFPAPLNAEIIHSLCEQKGADMLLALESFHPFFSTETVTEEYEDGSRSTTNYVDLVVEAGLSLYDPSGEVIDRLRVSESTHYQTRPALSRFVVIGPAMGKAGEEVNNLATLIGPKYLRSFYPGSMMVTNMIYTGKDFSEVTPRMRNHDWPGAVDLLLPLAGSRDPKVAKRAAHNLAIAYEAMGNYAASDQWKQKAGD